MRDEGVIKFECRWKQGAAPTGEIVELLIKYRQQLFQMDLIGVYPDGIGFGNISAREPGARDFVISASQTGHIADVLPHHFALVTDYSVADNRVDCVGPMKASSESLTHAMIYDIFPDANAVIHVHNHENWRRLQGIIATSSANVPYGTPEMALEVRRLSMETDLPVTNIFVMAGHEDGILSFGPTLDAAKTVLLGHLQ